MAFCRSTPPGGTTSTSLSPALSNRPFALAHLHGRPGDRSRNQLHRFSAGGDFPVVGDRAASRALGRRAQPAQEPAQPVGAQVGQERRQAKADLERIRRSVRETSHIADTLEHDVEEGFNPFWGLLFKEGNENSRFGQQVEQYACVYTSRVSNFLYYSPMQYFRSPRDLMPHEQAGALSGKLSPLGSEGPAIGSGKD